jgi:hypothetical protein
MQSDAARVRQRDARVGVDDPCAPRIANRDVYRPRRDAEVLIIVV